jgi:uncharacterized membrane protein
MTRTTSTTTSTTTDKNRHRVRVIARVVLGAFLIGAGIGHLTWARTSFRAQVPQWMPGNIDAIIVLSGVVEIALGTALIRARTRWIGWIAAAFFIAVFPGNIAQYMGHRDAFGLDTDARRAARLLFQPALVAWAIFSTNKLPKSQSVSRSHR